MHQERHRAVGAGYRSAVRLQKTCEQFEQRRLPASVFTDQDGDPTRTQREIVDEQEGVAPGLGEAQIPYGNRAADAFYIARAVHVVFVARAACAAHIAHAD